MHMAKLTSAVPVLTARDVAGAVEFWTDRLGFSRDFVEDDFAGVVRDDVTLFISAVQDQVSRRASPADQAACLQI